MTDVIVAITATMLGFSGWIWYYLHLDQQLELIKVRNKEIRANKGKK